jgi:hypothetical protein
MKQEYYKYYFTFAVTLISQTNTCVVFINRVMEFKKEYLTELEIKKALDFFENEKKGDDNISNIALACAPTPLPIYHRIKHD